MTIIFVYNKLNEDKEKKLDITNFYNLYTDKLLYKIINKNLTKDNFTNLIILSISFYKKKLKKKNKQQNMQLCLIINCIINSYQI
jgi:uncharacterized protein YbgA (DUF1722 family)